MERLSVSKKLLFGAIPTLALLAALVAGEIGYRRHLGIPLLGGKIRNSDLFTPGVTVKTGFEDTLHPREREFLEIYRRSANPILLYEPRPGYSAGPLTTNSHGFRDHEYALEKPAGTFRIAVLGDSIVWGHGLALEDSFPKQLERILNEILPGRFEVLNFAVSGYSTLQEVELFRVKASRFDPDLVVVGYCINDYHDASVEGRVFRQLYYDILHKSYLASAAKSRLLHVLGIEPREFKDRFNSREQFELLHSYAGGGTQVIVIFPALMSFQRHPMRKVHDFVKETVKGLDYEVVDLIGPFSAHRAEDLIQKPRDFTHPNALGTRIAAEATVEALLARGLISSP